VGLLAAMCVALGLILAAGALARRSGGEHRHMGAYRPAGGSRAHPIDGIVPDVSTGSHYQLPPLAHVANVPYNGGPVLHSNRTHVIFWQPSGSGLKFDQGYETLVDRFLRDVAADSHKPTNPYGLSGQYTDSTGPAAYDSTFGGSVVATDRMPGRGSDCAEPLFTGPGWTDCVTDGDIQKVIDDVVSRDHLPTTGRDVYFLVTPNGLGSCTDSTSSSCALGGSETGFCGYHSVTSLNVLYAVIPYNAVRGHCQSVDPRPNASTGDPALSTVSHEHNEMVTDPFGNAWIDGDGNEVGDLCITDFGPPIGGAGAGAWNEVIHADRYYLQEEWSNEDGGCRPRAKSDPVSFTGRGTVPARQSDRLTARARDPDGRIVAYAWFIGRRELGRKRILNHAFEHPGAYRVMLRVTDSADNWAFYSRRLRVTAPRPRSH
jgi:hypothetical protein